MFLNMGKLWCFIDVFCDFSEASCSITRAATSRKFDFWKNLMFSTENFKFMTPKLRDSKKIIMVKMSPTPSFVPTIRYNGAKSLLTMAMFLNPTAFRMMKTVLRGERSPFWDYTWSHSRDEDLLKSLGWPKFEKVSNHHVGDNIILSLFKPPHSLFWLSRIDLNPENDKMCFNTISIFHWEPGHPQMYINPYSW